MARAMVVIGVTGGVASGKSQVADCLRRLGARVIAADEIGHAVLREPAVRSALVERWGSGVLDASGEISRPSVAARVFAPPPDGPRELAFLEQWTHPRIRDRLVEQLGVLARQAEGEGGRSVVVLDAAVLYKAGWDAVCDAIVFVDAVAEARLARARQRGWSDAQWRARESAQPALAQQRARADWVIDNSGSLESLSAQVAQFWQWVCGGVPAVKNPEQPFSKRRERP